MSQNRDRGNREQGTGNRNSGHTQKLPRRSGEVARSADRAPVQRPSPSREGDRAERGRKRSFSDKPQGRGFHGYRTDRPRLTPRDAALRALEDVARGDAFAAQALDRRLEEARLKPDDRRLAAGLFYSAVENRLYLEHMLARFLESKPEPVVNDILHIAAAQLLFMDRVPDHAAVDEAVKQVRAARREGFAGLVNGVLRNLIRARDAGELTLPDRESDPLSWLSVKYSIARPAAKRLIDAYGLDGAAAIAGWTPPRREQTVRPNLTRMDAAGFEKWLNGQQLKWHPGAVPGAWVIEDAGNLAASDGYRQGLFSIQGQSAMLAALAVEPRPGMQILDACAAPGGKSCLLAEKMGTSGRVHAWDMHAHRVELIRAAAKRLGLENVRPAERDARRLPENMKWAMDAVLVDAPCSGLGVIADKPDIKYRQTEESLTALPPIQRDILQACAEAVRPGGLLVYATCTILPEENEAQVRAFLDRHPEFEPDADDKWLPEALKPRLVDGMLQILPDRDGLEGFFIARMRRK